jgi:hypothetical protein
MREDVDPVHDLAHAEHAQDPGDLAVADAHGLFELPGRENLGQADRDARPPQTLRRLLVDGGATV